MFLFFFIVMIAKIEVASLQDNRLIITSKLFVLDIVNTSIN